MRLKVASATDPGLEREENEDSVIVWRDKAGLDTLLVVCDGMGGHAAGQMASSIAVTTLTSVLAEDGDEGPGLDRLKRACKQANTAVFEAARDNPDWAGIASSVRASRPTPPCSRPPATTPIGRAWAAPWSWPRSAKARSAC